MKGLYGVHCPAGAECFTSGFVVENIEQQVPQNTINGHRSPFTNCDTPSTPFTARTSLARLQVAPQSFLPQPIMSRVVEFTAEKCYTCEVTWDGCTPEQREQWARFTSAATGRHHRVCHICAEHYAKKSNSLGVSLPPKHELNLFNNSVNAFNKKPATAQYAKYFSNQTCVQRPEGNRWGWISVQSSSLIN